MENSPSGLPYLNRMRDAPTAGYQGMRQTLDAHSKALERYSRFVVHGVIPEDFNN